MHPTTTNRINNGKNDKMKQIDQLSIINGQNFGSYHQNDDKMIIVNKDDNQNIVLLEISFQYYALLTLGTPVLALIIAFLLGFLSDYQQILNYDWTCGPVEIPSFSRIINLSKERIIWNAAVLFHLPLRILLIAINYRICRIPSNETNNHKLHMILSRIIILSGSIEILMALLVTVIGEREETPELDGNNFRTLEF
uniref:CWH43-like N-terminal domain-containing protein n=1 Tax=Onchocerca volvulus TaxID=6282 RepID=A0A8R1XR59_ONCVO